MKRLIWLFFIIILLFYSFANADNYSINVDIIIENMKNLEEVDLQRIKDEAEKLIAEIQANNIQESSYTGIWQEKYKINEFDEVTDQKYIYAMIENGTYSDRLVEDKELTVCFEIELIYDSPQIYISLFKNGDKQVKNIGNPAKYYLRVREENSDTHDFIMQMWSEAISFPLDLDQYYQNDKTFINDDKILKMLINNKSLKFVVVADYDNSTYKFNIDNTTGFENALKWLMDK